MISQSVSGIGFLGPKYSQEEDTVAGDIGRRHLIDVPMRLVAEVRLVGLLTELVVIAGENALRPGFLESNSEATDATEEVDEAGLTCSIGRGFFRETDDGLFLPGAFAFLGTVFLVAFLAVDFLVIESLKGGNQSCARATEPCRRCFHPTRFLLPKKWKRNRLTQLCLIQTFEQAVSMVETYWLIAGKVSGALEAGGEAATAAEQIDESAVGHEA